MGDDRPYIEDWDGLRDPGAAGALVAGRLAALRLDRSTSAATSADPDELHDAWLAEYESALRRAPPRLLHDAPGGDRAAPTASRSSSGRRAHGGGRRHVDRAAGRRRRARRSRRAGGVVTRRRHGDPPVRAAGAELGRAHAAEVERVDVAAYQRLFDGAAGSRWTWHTGAALALGRIARVCAGAGRGDRGHRRRRGPARDRRGRDQRPHRGARAGRHGAAAR